METPVTETLERGPEQLPWLRFPSRPVVQRRVVAFLMRYRVVVVPTLLGRGVRLWDGLEGLQKVYAVEATASPSGVTHLTFTRANS